MKVETYSNWAFDPSLSWKSYWARFEKHMGWALTWAEKWIGHCLTTQIS